MPHGDFSDVAALLNIAVGAACLAFPQAAFSKLGGLEAVFDVAPSAELIAALRVIAAFLLGWGFVLSINRWNTVNGKVGALLCHIAAGTIVYNQVYLDSFVFKLRPQYVVALLFLLTSLHLIFFANPLHTAQSLKAEEDAKAAKAAKKSS